ncbi:hypothetical protein [Achromobacter arsenitoxydans]|uniref:Uncharacterized protein n=1 Tax=Achromobacter arsenitoxydans SY8 TaxID=477184 RepID=H0FC12_9BURK|nr:hypothetical protein [Achromobacter arsenitoxydans]EHK64144.1 hypothetical protein KYC_21606 [Achromobacter arsenitoxydans SY8]
MSDGAVTASYDKLAQDAADGVLPRPQKICTECTVPGSLFSLNPDGGPRNADLVLGIPSQGTAATYRWFMDNPWIRDRERNYRDTFLLQVLDRFGAQYGEARMAELWAFIAVQECEIVCLDDDIADDALAPPVLDNFGQRTDDRMGFRIQRNFRFAGGKLYYLTFTSVTWEHSPRIEYEDPDGQSGISMPFSWNTPKGLFPVDVAVQHLAREFEQAKANVRIWEAIKGFFEVAVSLLAFVPVAGEVALGARGAMAGVRYLFVAVDRALAIDALGDGTSRMITGEGLSIGEKFFETFAALANPETAEARAKQVFMSINLAMLTPSAFGAARWIMREVGGKAVKLDVKMLNEADLKRLGGHKNGQGTALEAVIDTRDQTLGGTRVRVRQRYSTDTNKSQTVVEAEAARADFAVINNSARERTALQIHLIGSARKGKSLHNVVGDAGEEILAAQLVRHWGVKPDNILGYALKSGGVSRFGLKNKSNHGLDMLVRVPPPPEMLIRVPSAEGRHRIEGLRDVSQQQKVVFNEETLIVMEVKTTLGKSETPGLLEKTQGKGGEDNTERILANVKRKGRWWKREKVLELDPLAMEKVAMLDRAKESGNIQYVHAQVFLNSEGKINTLVGHGVGQGSGIQLNNWPRM